MRLRYLFAAALVLSLCLGGAVAVLAPAPAPACPSLVQGPAAESILSKSTFGAVTTFSLPSPGRWPNAIAVAPDGSVWFGEDALPALAHLFPANGTLVEYRFPGTYQPNYSQGYDCGDKTDIWGVALWDGRVWATDSAQNRLVGLSPNNATFRVVPLATEDSLPYTLAPGPDGALWFTQVNSGQIGTLYPNGTVVEHAVRVGEHLNGTSAPVYVPGVPAQVVFANATAGFYVDASPLLGGSAIFAFDPAHFAPRQVGGNQSLSDPDSIALAAGGVWLAQHADSSLAFYDLTSGNWTIYPTSRVSYIGTSLPYFVEANGSLLWFNEHFGNRMAVLDPGAGTLTEYSLSDPPAGNISEIGNALTSAVGGGKAWFTESTAGTVGFVDASYRPSFSVAPGGSSSLSVRRGQEATVTVYLEGTSAAPISVAAEPQPILPPGANITLHASESEVSPLAGNQSLAVAVDVGAGTPPGSYTLVVTASDGLISRSVYFQLAVSP